MVILHLHKITCVYSYDFGKIPFNKHSFIICKDGVSKFYPQGILPQQIELRLLHTLATSWRKIQDVPRPLTLLLLHGQGKAIRTLTQPNIRIPYNGSAKKTEDLLPLKIDAKCFWNLFKKSFQHFKNKTSLNCNIYG